MDSASNATQNVKDALVLVPTVLNVLLDSSNADLPVAKFVLPTNLLTEAITDAFFVVENARPVQVNLSVPLAPTLKQFQSTESVTIAHTHAIPAEQPHLNAQLVLKDSVLSVLPVLLHAPLELSLRTESVSATLATSTPTNVLPNVQ